MDDLRKSTCDAFKHLYWTRLISCEHHQVETPKNWPIGPDLADEFDHIFWIEEDDLPQWQANWDTSTFSKAHPNLNIEDWKLKDE